MDGAGHVVKDALFTLTHRDGTAFTLVTFADGGYGIMRGGRLVDGCRWPGGEIERCIKTLVDLAGLDDDEGQPS